MRYFELQPLRIPSGWTVKYNNFSEYDLQTHGAEYAYESKSKAGQDRCK